MKSDWHAHEPEEGLHRPPSGRDQSIEDHSTQQICCRCFKFIQGDEPNHEDGEEERLCEELFCSPCQAILTGSYAVGGHAALFPASPLPKLSLLVQTEAKYQGQLQALKQQQDLLLQQQELLRASKQAQLDQAAKEKELARERRRQFQMVIERRKREEEQKYLQFTSDNKSASHQENHDGDSNEDATVKTKQKKRIVRQAPAGPPSMPLAVSKPSTPTTTLPELDAGPSHEQMQQQQRNKQRLLTMGCYAQDLTPLVNGDRPKRLPMPIPSVYVVDSKKKPQRQPAAAAVGSSGANRLQVKTKAKKTLRLHPLGKSASPSNSYSPSSSHNKASENENQQQEEHELSISVPRYRSHDFGAPSAPLTAEIKPAAWIYELGKDVMDEDDEDHSPGFSSKVHTKNFAFDNNLPSTLKRLASVPEEMDRHDDMDLADSSAMAAKYQPLAKLSVPLSSSASAAASTASSWEYSTERLTSLLEKYNVSVTHPNGSRV